MKATYRKHHFNYPEAHIFFDGKESCSACSITLKGSVSMTQDELDRYGKVMAEALNKLED